MTRFVWKLAAPVQPARPARASRKCQVPRSAQTFCFWSGFVAPAGASCKRRRLPALVAGADAGNDPAFKPADGRPPSRWWRASVHLHWWKLGVCPHSLCVRKCIATAGTVCVTVDGQNSASAAGPLLSGADLGASAYEATGAPPCNVGLLARSVAAWTKFCQSTLQGGANVALARRWPPKPCHAVA